MSTSASMSVSSPRPTRRARPLKVAAWTVMGLMTLSVLFLSELPLLRPGSATRAHLLTIRWLLLPHVVCASVALTTGAVQFSSRIRRWSLPFHRVTGRVYVAAICIAGPAAIVMSHGTAFFTATLVQAGTWITTAIAALLTARNRQIEQHRQWVVRSYAVTFGFILLHLLNPLPFWSGISDNAYATAIVIATFLAVLIPDIVFCWGELTRRRGAGERQAAGRDS